MDNKALNNTLEAVANGTTSIDDCTTVLLQHVRTVVRKFLKANPTHGYLKDDLIASGSLSMVMTCQRFQREGVEIANAGYLSTCIWNGLLDTVRLEQVITPPRSFKGLLTNPEDMPARVPLDDIAVDTWEDAKHFDELVEGLNTTETEQEILNQRLAGFNRTEVSKKMGLEPHEVKKQLTKLKRKWENL